MMAITRRTAIALGAGAALNPAPSAAAAETAAPASPVAAVLARHPWILQPQYVESTALAGKLAEYLGWPGTAGRAVVRSAYEEGARGGHTDTDAFLADVDRRIAAVLASGEPLPLDRAHGPEAEARFARIMAEIEDRLTKKALHQP
jgi:hypothetical protein